MQLLEPEGPAQLTEYGKRYFDAQNQAMQQCASVIRDVARLAEWQKGEWDRICRLLEGENVPTMITSGISQVTEAKVVDHVNGKTSFTIPATVALGLGTTAPTATTTGATFAEISYTTYARQTIINTAWNAATAATPSVATNNGAITFPACTAGGGTLLGFMILDSATLAAGNGLWYGTLTSTVISTTQTPPTVANTAMSVSLTGT